VRILLDGSVKLVDFGIARVEDSSMTQTGLILGTPSYISPEILAGGRVDHRADMWAVGVVLYEVLAGKLPYEGSTIAALVYKIVHEPPPPLDCSRLGLPPRLGAIVSQALAKDPAQRYLDMAQMAGELQEAMGLAGGTETPLFGAAREQAYQRELQEAQRMLAGNDLERALEAARRARALEPSRTEVVALIQRLEDLLVEAPTVRELPGARARPSPPPTRAVAPNAAPPVQPTRTVPAEPTRDKRLRTAVLTELRARGASVFRELATFGEPPATSAASLSPVPGRDLLATSGSDGGIRIWDLQSRTRVIVLRTEMHQRTGHDALGASLAFSPDGTLLASGHIDGAVHVWDVARGQEIPTRLRHDASVGALAFSPDGRTLASGGMDSNLKLWDVAAALAGEARRELVRQPSAVTALSFAGAGAWIVTGHANRILRVLDAQTCRLKATLRGPEALVSLLCATPDGKRLAAVSQDRTIRLFDIETQSQLAVLSGHRKAPTSLSFFSDGKHLVSVALENAVQVWDIESCSNLAALWGPSDESFAGVALFAGGDHIAVALADGRIRLWEPAS
jgi:hypothetical protein